MTELILHMGLGKTGTSALQVAFVQHRDHLLDHGVLYPESDSDGAAAKGHVTSGNGLPLARYLVPRIAPKGTPPQDHIAPLLDTLRAATDSDRVLVSSEFMQHFEADRLADFLSLLDRRVTVRAVMYVRDIAGHALSEYSQQVKRARHTGSFAEFIDPEPGNPGYWPGLQRWLTLLVEHLGRDHVTLIHYDSVRTRLVPHFASHVLGVPLDQAQPRTVNRSLTSDEVRMMRTVNSLVSSPREGAFVSNQIISLDPIEPAGPTTITADEMAILERRFANPVRWINDFGVEEGALRVPARDVQIADHAPDRQLSEREEFLVRVLARTARRWALDAPVV